MMSDNHNVTDNKTTSDTDTPNVSFAYLDNPIINNLPNHLKQFIISQNYSGYTAIDHSVWRYVMRQNFHFLKDNAHESYVEGLKATGIDIERIPSIEGMNEILGRIGWAAVPVDGFIPPAAFMEFQAHHVLVIAADMRQINHISYTPAPDIIHEAAGHAPIIADKDYAEYLRKFGEIGSKAMSSRKDFELYEAIRRLSILKERPDASDEEIKIAEKEVEEKQDNLGTPSEMALLSRLHWWTVEYGLIGTLDNPKIYGAGLLSSIGESANYLNDSVEKLPYNLKTAEYAFDITTQQPQLFVTPSFEHLSTILEEFAKEMAFVKGGADSLDKAIECERVSTMQYSSGLQVSGIIGEYIKDDDGNPIYVRTTSPTALASNNKELEGHSKKYHSDGFSSPVGRFDKSTKPPELLTDDELTALDIIVGQKCDLIFNSGVEVSGLLQTILRNNSAIQIMTFTDCTVTLGNQVLFEPEWGTYDMAVGEKIISVFSGAADKDAFDQIALIGRERTIRIEQDSKTKGLINLHRQVRAQREAKTTNDLPDIWIQLQKIQHESDWLCALEILEMVYKSDTHSELSKEVKSYLNSKLSNSTDEMKKLINDGLALLQ